MQPKNLGSGLDISYDARAPPNTINTDGMTINNAILPPDSIIDTMIKTEPDISPIIVEISILDYPLLLILFICCYVMLIF